MNIQTIPAPFVSLKFPVILVDHLHAFQEEAYLDSPFGLTAYNGVIVIWDADYDTRAFAAIDKEFSSGSTRPIAIGEREGGIAVLWATEEDARFAYEEYFVDGDHWPARNYYIQGKEVMEFES